MKQHFILQCALIFAFSQSALAQHGPSPIETKSASRKASLVSTRESDKMTCLDFGPESDYEIEVIFKKELQANVKANKDISYLLAPKAILESNAQNEKLKVGPHCELFVSASRDQQSTVKANSPYTIRSAPGRMSGEKDAAGRELRGCRLNLNEFSSKNPSITSLQCFVNGAGEASIADLRKAFANHGEIVVRKK